MVKRPKKKQLNQDAVPTTSLADMMFLLLIFFIMTTTLARVTGFDSEMPSGTKNKAMESEQNITVGLANGKLTLQDRPKTIEQVEKELKAMQLDKRPEKGRIVVLTSTGKEAYDDYFRVLSLIQACGGVVAIESGEGERK
jgi:biopolymer transport protein ExbD